MVDAFLGLRGTGDWVTGDRPLAWRNGIFRLYPDGAMALTGLTAMMEEEKVTDPEFNWWTKTLPLQGGALTDIYTDTGMTTAYVSAGAAGDVLYVKAAEDIAEEFRVGHDVVLRYTLDMSVDVKAKVTAILLAGASSKITVKLLEADNNSSLFDLSDADTILVTGNLNAEGAGIPTTIAYDPVKIRNYSQIFRTPLEITRTARETTLRTEDAYMRAKKECLEIHTIELEKEFLWGIPTENTGANGKPERTTMGVAPFIKTYAPSNVFDFSNDAGYSGSTWLAGGEDWLDSSFEVVARFGYGKKFVMAGSGAIRGINRLAKQSGQINLTPQTTSFGLSVMNWVTPFGTWVLYPHPLLSYEPTTRNMMVVIEPKDMKYRFVTDTKFYDMPQGQTSPSHERYDGTKEEYLTECGLEFHHPLRCGLLYGVGLNNRV